MRVIIDDPIKTGEAMSDAERNGVNDWYRNTAFSRLNNKETGVIIIVSQRVHHDDLIGRLLETEGDDWSVLEIPAIATEDDRFPIGDGEWYFRKEGEPIHAARESLETLEKIRAAVGSYVFSAQYQQNPVPPGGVLLKREWFGRYQEPPDLESFEMIVDSWDTASGIGSDSAYSACTTWGVGNKRLYLLSCQRHRLEFPDLVRQISYSAHVHHAHAVLVERASSGVQVLQTLQETNIPMIGITPRGDKIARAIQVSPIIEAGKVLLPEEAPWLAEFENEVARFPHSKFKDQVDSMTQFLNWTQRSSPRRLACRVTVFTAGRAAEVYTDRYFERMGVGVFDNLF